MTNDSIDARGTRVQALGVQGRKTSDVNAC